MPIAITEPPFLPTPPAPPRKRWTRAEIEALHQLFKRKVVDRLHLNDRSVSPIATDRAREPFEVFVIHCGVWQQVARRTERQGADPL